ncbi:MAG TPA: penicillin-binding protein activator [Kofleriaceae bacterium]|nr:penicillin-binding protein activator [Kofleriaceae bacterium]
MRRSLLIAALILLAACPGRTRRPLTIPEGGDAGARQRFVEARQQFERSGGGGERFEAIAEQFPGDPVAPYALLYAGMAAVRAGDHKHAVELLGGVDPGGDDALRRRTDLYLGIALVYRGDPAHALPRLQRGEEQIEGDGERAEWLAAMAEAVGRGPQPLDALPRYDAWHKVARGGERAYIVDRLQALVAAADAGAARRAWDKIDHGGPAGAVLGLRVAADLAAGGDLDGAAHVRGDIADAARRIGLDVATPAAGGDPRRLGVVLPLSGKRAQVAELALRGMIDAAGGLQRGGDAGVELWVRDSRSESVAAGTAAQGLAAAGAIALVGPLDGASAAAAAEHAAGAPVITLDPRPAAHPGGAVFHVMHSAEARARALARWAFGKGVRRAALLAPTSGYGRAVGDAFGDEWKRLGGTLAASADYAPEATAFAEPIKQLGAGWQALFVPDQAARLALITPALAAAGMIAQPVNEPAPRQGRALLLLSTAEGLDDRFARLAGRYCRGAVLAPGFYPDRFDPRFTDFIDRHELAFGHLPTAWDAYAHDAVAAVAQAIAGGARSRAAVAAALLAGEPAGLTGPIRFTPAGLRADDGILYTVELRADSGEPTVRVLRQ